jgi:hypothetical protein
MGRTFNARSLGTLVSSWCSALPSQTCGQPLKASTSMELLVQQAKFHALSRSLLTPSDALAQLEETEEAFKPLTEFLQRALGEKAAHRSFTTPHATSMISCIDQVFADALGRPGAG